MKKNKRLAIQVGLIVSVMFILTISILAYVVRQGTLKMYMEIRNAEICSDVSEFRDLFMSPEVAEWVLDEWQKDPGMMSEPADDTEKNIYEDLKYTTDAARTLTMENIEWLEPDVRRAFLKALYRYNVEYFEKRRIKGDFNAIYCLDIRDYDDLYETAPDDIAIIFECSQCTGGSGDYGLGQYLDNEEGFTSVAVMQKGTYGTDYGDMVFQMLYAEDEDEGEDTLLYLGISPVLLNGKLRYILCVVYDWSVFAHTLNENLTIIFIWGAIGLFATNTLLIFFIYLKAVRPMVKVNNGVRRYIEDKNSSTAVQTMSAVKAKNEVGRLADSFSELAVEIDRYTEEILTLTGEKERVVMELDLATKIQADMLPTEFPDRPELELCASMVPAKEVGGDFYDFFFIDDDHLGLVIADVSGKGVPAALFMMMAKMLVKNYAMTGSSPAEVLSSANRSICENNKNKMFVTVWFGILDTATGHITAANAGHEYPMIRKAGGGFEKMKDKHGFVLGAIENKKYTEYEFDIEPGGTLFVYTDGAAEAANADQKLFGTERMLAALNKEPSAAPEVLLRNMRSAIDQFVGEAPQFDDLTMLCVRYNGKQEEQI